MPDPVPEPIIARRNVETMSELLGSNVERCTASLLAAFGLRSQRGPEDRLAAPTGYSSLPPATSSGAEKMLALALMNPSTKSPNLLDDCRKADSAYQLTALGSPERSAKYANLQDKVFKLSMSIRQSSVVNVHSDGASVTEPSLASLKELLRRQDPPPLNLKRIVISKDLGQWRSPTGMNTPILGLTISTDGVLKISEAVASDPELCRQIISRAIAIEARLCNEELDYADSAESQRTGVKNQAGFRMADADETEFGFLSVAGKEYAVLLPNAGRVIGMIYPGFSADGQVIKNKAFYVDRADINLDALYQKLVGFLDQLNDPSDIDRVLIASALVRTRMEPTLESKITGLPEEATVPLGAYLTPGVEKGECRQLAVTLGYLIERMIEDRRITGSFRFIANYGRSVADGHAAIEYRSGTGTAVIFDPTHSRFLPTDFIEAKTCAELGAWSYRSPKEIAALRGQPLWIS